MQNCSCKASSKCLTKMLNCPNSLIPPMISSSITSSSKYAWVKMECSVSGWRSELTSWLSGSHSQRVVNFCPTTAPLLAAREDLGDTKQEVLNKWKLWMFISRHSSSAPPHPTPSKKKKHQT